MHAIILVSGGFLGSSRFRKDDFAAPSITGAGDVVVNILVLLACFLCLLLNKVEVFVLYI